jgi:hypothetical protein
VTALVCKNPETSAKEALDYSIYSPQRSSNWCRRDAFRGNELVEQVENDSKAGDIPSNIAQPSQSRPLEAVLGNCISNIVDSVVWNLEFVAVGINEFAKTMFLRFVEGGHT